MGGVDNYRKKLSNIQQYGRMTPKYTRTIVFAGGLVRVSFRNDAPDRFSDSDFHFPFAPCAAIMKS